MKFVAQLIFCSLLFSLFVGCGRDHSDYQQKLKVKTNPVSDLSFFRYEDALFQMDTARFQEELMAVQNDFLPFLSGDLSDPDAVRYLKDFAIDSFSVALYHKVKEMYPDLNEVREQVISVYGHFHYYYPDIPVPQKIYTCVSGVNPEIPPVMLVDDALVISLDWYLDRDAIYDRIGMPKYRSERTGKKSLGKDLALLLYQNGLSNKHQQTNLLEEMVSQGKSLFFIEALCPGITDETLLGYSTEQLRWAETNEGNLWADIVGKQCLYSSEYELFRVFFADGPFTNEYSYDAPARLGDFVGLHIIRSYFQSHDVTVQQLMDETDLQKLFQESGYKPKK
jgi:hypothetical protein